MAFEDFTTKLLARAAEALDPGSADAYLRLTVAAEATLKLTGICLLSEAVYRHGSEPAKTIIGEIIAGRSPGWAPVIDFSACILRDSRAVSDVRRTLRFDGQGTRFADEGMRARGKGRA